MRKKWFILPCLLLLVALILPVSAQGAPKVIDEAELFTAAQAQNLERRAQQLCNTYELDVVLVTKASVDGASVEAFADDYFDYNGYGVGNDASGVLFLLVMDTREWAISTCGECIYALTDYGQQEIFSDMAGFLSDGDYYQAFDRYLQNLDTYFAAYRDGEPIDGQPGDYTGPGSFEHGTQEEIVHPDRRISAGTVIKRLLLALAIGCGVGAIVLLIFRSGMNTAKAQRSATDYMKSGSYHLSGQRDIFLYSHTSRTRKSDDSGHSGGGRSGGSSVHHSSSGRSHGGSHGRF